MRAVLFFISLFTMLIGAGPSASAAAYAYPAKEKSTFHHQVQSTDNDHYWTIDESDLDNSEEIAADHFKDKVQTIITVGFHEQWLIGKRLPHVNRSYFFPHFCGQSTPIYLAHRVLRI
ncbi:hypothetical protein [Flavobacterium sp.]|uniref:hypothetical protein n=1 Tax=Flavobacterium sp. TaxID=239 RepID=UPI0039E4D8A4